MARPTTRKVRRIEAELRRRIDRGSLLPGEAFFSGRQLAERFGISYQTAHRLLGRLTAEGLLLRHGRSGTYIAGQRAPFRAVVFLFHERGRQRGSFGDRLLACLAAACDAEGLPWRVGFDARASTGAEELPVLWEAETAARRLARLDRPFVVLNDLPPPGAEACCDTLEIDDLAGGRLAAGHLRERGCRRPVLIAGPRKDSRSRHRVEGFLRRFPDAEVRHNRTWFFDEAVRMTFRIRLDPFDGAFCANDRLAEALIRSHLLPEGFPVVGFDGAPISARMNLTTVSFPWEAFSREFVDLVRARLRGGDGPARRRVLAPHLVERGRSR